MGTIDPALQIRRVELGVADLARSADFYERVIGLPLISGEGGTALLGTDPARPALALRAVAEPVPLDPHATGLYHVAWLHPSRAALADSVRRVAGQRWPFEGASDHGVSEALYLSDPDGLGIELYADRPRERWATAPDGRHVEMYTAPLDLDDLLAQSQGEPDAAVAPGTLVGHVHMKVADVPRAEAFWAGVLGFEERALLPSAAFLAAGGYHHHVGLNSWQSRGADGPAAGMPGLLDVRFELGGESLERLERALAGAGAGVERPAEQALSVRDPDGQRVTFAAAG